jgi:cell division transport system ATP-binding protein
MVHNEYNLSKVVVLEQASIINEEHTVLENVNFDLVDAEFCYVIGKSGSGKSSLLKTLYGGVELQSGSAEVVGMNLKELNRANTPAFRRKLGIIFQEFHLFNGWTVADNLEYVLKATGWNSVTERAAKIKDTLEEVNLTKAITDKVYQLSGGQQQKLVIARAIINDPVLIIADEPTANLDAEASDEIIYLMKRISEKYKTATLFATHDRRLMEKFPARTVLCENGELTELSY